MSVEEKFNRATEYVRSLPANGPVKPSNDTKLKFYSHFKQAKEGKCNTSRPGMMDFTGKAKWDAWNALGDMGKEEAMQGYINALLQVLETSDLDSAGQEVVTFLKGPNIRGNHIRLPHKCLK